MKNFKLLFLAFTLLFVTMQVNAQSIGYANFKKIEQNYDYAKKSYKELDDKVLELQQYVIDKDKQFKAIESPIQRKNFEEKTQKEFKAKEDTILKQKVAKEEEVFDNIMYATKAVASEKQIDVVLDFRVIFTGGVDLTDDIINYVNTNNIPKKK